MSQLTERQSALENLVDELMKDHPRPELVKRLTNELGLTYSIDPIKQMNTVLTCMDSVYISPVPKRDLES